MAFRNCTLYPPVTVARNTAFALETAAESKSESVRKMAEATSV